MFEDSFLFNLVVFLAGQAAAWAYLRTGRIRRGVAMMVAGWMLLDAALLARFVYENEHAYVASLLALQVYSLVEGGLLVFGRLRRRSAAVRKRRAASFRRAVLSYLGDDLAAAEAVLRRLRRSDPWDLEVTLALGTVLARAGKSRRARALLRSARDLDCKRRFRDVIEHECERSGL